MDQQNEKIFYKDQSFQLKQRIYKSGECLQNHHHDYLSISLLLNGTLTEDSNQNSVVSTNGWLSIKPVYIDHANTFTASCSIISLAIYDWAYYGLDFNEWSWSFTGNALKHFIHLAHCNNKREAFKAFKKEIIQQNATEPQESLTPNWLFKVRSIIHAHYQESIKITELALEVGKHPIHVARTFALHFGMDIKRYQRQLRIHHSMQQLLSNSRLPHIAFDQGFSDQSHFTREFKKSTSFSPLEARKAFNV